MHAVDEALNAVTRVAESTDDPRVMMAAAPLALQLLSQEAASAAARIIAASQAIGFASFTAEIGGQA